MPVKNWSSTAAANTEVGGLSTDGNIQTVNNIDGMFRGMMADIRTGINAGSFLGHAYVANSGNYTALLADWGTLFHFTGAATLALTAAATLTAGWSIVVRARGGAVTIDPNSTELINGASTLVIPDGKSVLIVCTGTAFMTAYDSTPSLKAIQRITASQTYTRPTDVKALLIRAVGGGGGGGGASTPSGVAHVGGGGGSGAYGEIYLTAPAASYVVTIGAAGTAGTTAPSAGGGGGATSVGSVLNVGGGSGGLSSVVTTLPLWVGQGDGGTVSTGGDTSYGGAGGNPGVKLDANARSSGAGADSPFGTGGTGGAANNNSTSAAGNAGRGYGAGGGGAISSTTTAQPGGAAGAGYVEIWEFI